LPSPWDPGGALDQIQQQKELLFVQQNFLQELPESATVTLSLPSDDAYYVGRALSEIDVEMRRAAAVLQYPDYRSEWPRPLPTSHAGLQIVETRQGSLEVFLQSWGALDHWLTVRPLEMWLLTAGLTLGGGAVLRVLRRRSMHDQPQEQVMHARVPRLQRRREPKASPVTPASSDQTAHQIFVQALENPRLRGATLTLKQTSSQTELTMEVTYD
jgi:hypothetical protein